MSTKDIRFYQFKESDQCLWKFFNGEKQNCVVNCFLVQSSMSLDD